MVSMEETGLCFKRNPSLLRKKGKEDLDKFDMEQVCKELQFFTRSFSLPLQTKARKVKVKNDPRSEFSNLSNWKEEA